MGWGSSSLGCLAFGVLLARLLLQGERPPRRLAVHQRFSNGGCLELLPRLNVQSHFKRVAESGEARQQVGVPKIKTLVGGLYLSLIHI